MRILIVEDEVRLAVAVQRGLIDEGYDVDVVHDGEAGIWKALECQYDLIVLDLMLPKLNGYRVIERLRSVGIPTPILMLTAKDGDVEQVDALDLGADDYLTKPFVFSVLLARVRAVLRRGSTHTIGPLCVGSLVLDRVSHRVQRGDAEIDLTPREFTLLAYFMERAGAVVSKIDILDDVWGDGFDGPDNIVEVYVGYLRRKIDTPFNVRSLVTVRGFGYRLDAVGAAPD